MITNFHPNSNYSLLWNIFRSMESIIFKYLIFSQQIENYNNNVVIFFLQLPHKKIFFNFSLHYCL